MKLPVLPKARWILFLGCLLALPVPGLAQIDREFWFVGPEASGNHGERPVYIRVSTLEEAANINLRMPANLKFVPVVSAIPPNTTISIRLDEIGGDDTWLDSIENKPADRVLRKGLLLTSDRNVTAYYEINNSSNPAIFPLKGKNGVGTEFYIPGQTDYPNHANNGSEAFDIIATEDGTTITITPSIDIVGHPAGEPFQVILNMGETYSARTLITTASASLAGSHVVADKPVAITISDDSIVTGGWDIIGDQIVPVNLLGWEYVVIKGFASNLPAGNDERVYITATQDGTGIMLDGNPLPVATINAGEQYDYPIPNTAATVYIRTSHPVNVYHLSGHPDEAGASILPQDSCTGSRSVGFNRSSASSFALMILTRSGNEGSFQLNGDGSIITAPSFSVVPGTGGAWMFYRQNNLPVSQVPLGANLLMNSNGKFHLGILNNVGASSEYGYFSDFSTLYLGADASICPGDSMTLDGGPYRTSYDWRKLVAGNWVPVGTAQTYVVRDSGYYTCVTDGDFCLLMDTIHVGYYPNGTVSLGADRTICEGTTTTFEPGNFVTYEWSTGALTPTLTTGIPGSYWVRVTNNNGCIARDTVTVSVDSLPLANLPVLGPPVVCQGTSGVLYSVGPQQYATSYAWSLPPGASGSGTTNSLTVDFPVTAASGPLSVHGVNACGNGPDLVLAITVDPLPAAAGTVTGLTEVCQGQTGVAYTVPAILHATAYDWTVPPGCTLASGAGSASILVDFGLNAAPGQVTVSGQNACGDGGSSSIPVNVKLFPVPAGTITGTETVCQGQQGVTYSVPAITGADTYQWYLPAGAAITAGSGSPSVSVSFDSTALPGLVTVHGRSYECGDGVPSSMPVNVNPIPEPPGAITGPAAVCQGQPDIAFSVPAVGFATSYTWTLPPGVAITSGTGSATILAACGTGAVSGLVTVRGHNPTCGYGRRSVRPVTVNPLPLPAGDILGPTPVCQGEPGISYAVQNPDPFTDSWVWMLLPAGAGTVSGSTPGITVNWNDAFTGSATLAVNGLNGCGNGLPSPVFNITILPKPMVSYESCGDLATTKNARPVVLKGGFPAGPGGMYSGTGVTVVSPGTYAFDPSNSAVIPATGGTPYPITYRFTGANGCYREMTQVMRVYPSNALQPCPGTVTDVRDGRNYKTFLTGAGAAARCWLAENLNFGEFADASNPQTNNCRTEKYCIGNLAARCAEAGGNYQWDEVMNYSVTVGSQGICPPGWHVPSQAEWDLLINDNQGVGMAGGYLKFPGGVSGFNGLPRGIQYFNGSWHFTDPPGAGTFFWTSTVTGADRARAYGLNFVNHSVSTYHSVRAHGFPVRCVRDQVAP